MVDFRRYTYNTHMADAGTSIGPQIRAWRQTRGLSQFELASQAGFSVRHVSFIETGRSHPSREAVLALGDVLCLPFRERNRLLEAAGFARVFRETPLSADAMAHMRDMLQFILDRHLPYAAVVMDRHYNCLLSNRGASRFFPTLISPALSALPNNILRCTFHPEGSRRWIVNWPEVERHLLSRAELELGSAEDSLGSALLAEIRSYTITTSRDRFSFGTASRRSFASDSHKDRRSRSATVQHGNDSVHSPRHHTAGTADRNVLPGRSRIRALLAEEFR